MHKDCLIILAAGKGSRMKSLKPKMLIKIGGVSLVMHLLGRFKEKFSDVYLVIGHKGEMVMKETAGMCGYVWQREQLGTGHAIMLAGEELSLKKFDNIVVMPSDHPLLSAESVEKLLARHNEEDAFVSVLSVSLDRNDKLYGHYHNCGRILRNEKGEVMGIVELKDADEKQLEIGEFNTSCYCFKADWLWQASLLLKDNNKAKEYYLTDLIGMAVNEGRKVLSSPAMFKEDGLGVNTKEQLAVIRRMIGRKKKK